MLGTYSSCASHVSHWRPDRETRTRRSGLPTDGLSGFDRMSRGDAEIVRESLRTALEGTLPDLYAAISEDFLIHSSTGHLYVGHEGFREWLKRARSVYE